MPVCPVCGSKDTRVKFRKYSRDFLECAQCGLMFIFPPPTKEETEAIYTQAYYKSWGMEQGDNLTVRRMKIGTAEHILKQVENFIEPGRLLDVGCAAGHFMEAARQRDWDAYGIEISDYSAGLAKKKFGDHVYKGSFMTVSFPDFYFECVVMSDVLEHFQDPQFVLEKAGMLLKEGGLLAIVTPDTGSLSARLLKTYWNHYQKEHLIYYNRKNIQKSLERNHFYPVVVRGSKKAMNLKYMYKQMIAYPNVWLTPIFRVINWTFPEALLTYDFFISLGDMLVIARKKGE